MILKRNNEAGTTAWNIKPLFFVLIMFLGFMSCATFAGKNKTAQPQHDVNITYDAHVKSMLSTIEEINKNAPATFSLNFIITGATGDKKFKVTGEGAYDRNLKKMHISMADYIFKTPISMVFQDGEVIKVYFQVDKKVVEDSMSTMRVDRYVDFQCDFPVVYDLLTGKIPLIQGYTVKKGLAAPAEVSYVLLENDRFFETISFKEMVPDRIRFVDKSTRRETEIYIKERILLNNTTYFNRLRVVSGTEKEINLEFSAIRLNMPVRVKGTEMIPAGTQVIR